LEQKPYACQLPGCTKRYTDPSSLRKHVKNHALRNANGQLRRKSAGGASIPPAGPRKAAKTRRHSEGGVAGGSASGDQRLHRSNSCSEALLQPENDRTTGAGTSNRNNCGTTGVAANNNSMNFNELSNCIVIIEHNQSGDGPAPAAAVAATATATAAYGGNMAPAPETDVLSGSSNNNNNNNSNGHYNGNINQLSELEQLLTTAKPSGPSSGNGISLANNNHNNQANGDSKCHLSEFVSFEYVTKYLADVYEPPAKSPQPPANFHLQPEFDNSFDMLDFPQFI